MENATKRIRKARRQGLAGGKNLAPTTRANLSGSGMAGRDTPGTPRAGARRKSAITQRKTKRQARRTSSRPGTRRASARG